MKIDIISDVIIFIASILKFFPPFFLQHCKVWMCHMSCQKHFSIRIYAGEMFPDLYLQQKKLVYYLYFLLMDYKNLITGAQEEGVLFLLKTLTYCLFKFGDISYWFILFSRHFIDKIKALYSIFITFVSGILKFFHCQIVTVVFFFIMIQKLIKDKN